MNDGQAWRKDLRTVTLYLLSSDAKAQIAFLTDVFGATEVMREMDGDRVRHAQLQVGDSMIMIGEASGEYQAIPGAAYMNVDDVDATYARALAAGAETVYPPEDQDYGDRSAGVRDPQGSCWWIAAPA